MAVTYEKKHHERAKADRLWLVSVDIDGRPAKTFGRLTWQSPVTEAEAKELLECFNRLVAKRKKSKRLTADR